MTYKHKLGTILSLAMLASLGVAEASPQVAADLTRNYNNLAQNCGSSSKPAFLCSGVLMRGTQTSSAYYVWNPSPASVKSGGVAFTYLRADSKFNKIAMGYNSGFLFYPYDHAPSGKLLPEILCSFAVDADAVNRGDKGCGANTRYPTTSRACQSQGIYNVSSWLRHYNRVSYSNRRFHACGFDVRLATSNNAAIFNESLKGQAYAPESFKLQNELRLITWPQNIPTLLPIQAFYYTDSGLADARINQTDYYNKTQIIIPIIKITLPQTKSQQAKFEYFEQDQAVQ